MIENINYRTVMDYMSTQDQLDIWGQILGKSVSVGQTFTNFLRVDKHPGAFLREYSNVIFLTDYAAPEFNGYTCIHAVRDLMHCTLTQAATNVYASIYFNKPLLFNTSTTIGQKQKGRKSGTRIHFDSYTHKKQPTFRKISYKYWQKRFVTLNQLTDLNKGGRVYDVCNLYFDNNMSNHKENLCFSYTFPSSKIKVYQPFSKTQKWVGNVGKNDYWLTKRGSKNLLISKAQKDHLCCENIFLDYDIFSGMNETLFPYNFTDIISDYDYIISLLDNDTVGAKSARLLQKEYSITPKIIDPSTGFKDIDEFLVNQEHLPILKDCPIIDLM